jgi:pimeloyl-ACP methyl ester carboxylesterase
MTSSVLAPKVSALNSHVQKVDVHGVEIAIRTSGDSSKPWLVVCHGMALSSDEFLLLAEQLSDRWRILLWDMPGHGHSGALPDEINAEFMAEILAGLMLQRGIETAVLLGFSFGGIVAQYYARNHPSRLDGLILHACFAPFSQLPLLPSIAIRPVVFLTFETKSWAKVRAQFAKSCVSGISARKTAERSIDRLGKKGFLAMSRALLKSFQPDSSFRINCPLLLISGASDINGPRLRIAQAALMTVADGADRVVIPNATHCAHIEQPLEFAKAVDEFLTKRVKARSPAYCGD